MSTLSRHFQSGLGGRCLVGLRSERVYVERSANITRRHSSGPKSVSDTADYSNIDFTNNGVLPTRRALRAWDRVARSPRVTRNKSRNNGHKRKVWKRPEISTGAISGKSGRSDIHDARRDGEEDGDNVLVGTGEKRIALGEVSCNTPRAVKRLRLKDIMTPLVARESMNDHSSKNVEDDPPAEDLLARTRFLTTMRDLEVGIESPKRKPNAKFAMGRGQVQLQKASRPFPDNLSTTEDLNLRKVVEMTDSNHESGEAAFSSGFSQTQGNETNPEDITGGQSNIDAPETSSRENHAITPRQDDTTGSEDQKINTKPHATLEKMPSTSSTVAVVSRAHNDTDSGATALSNPTKEVPQDTFSADALDAGALALGSPFKLPSSRTPRTKGPIPGMTPNLKSLNDNGYVFDTPQIGTTLLRRESLRNKASPLKTGAGRKSESPRKKQGLKKRDTLQEREILQEFNANVESTLHPMTDQATLSGEDAVNIQLDPEQVKDVIADREVVGEVPVTDQREVELPSANSGQANHTTAPKEPSDQNEDAHDQAESQSWSVTPGEPEDRDRLAHMLSDENLLEDTVPVNREAETGVDATPPAGAEDEKGSYSTRQTRASARLSDDTTLLKDFLHRAQVKRAAREIPNLSVATTNLEAHLSPRRSPRKGQKHAGDAELAASPRKSVAAVSLRPGTPPPKPLRGDIEDGDGEDVTTEPTSYRRSTRSRLPAPSKTAPGPPSFIPLRRGDGTDPMILPKTAGQDLAVVTRANTRRNKGQAKPPVQALQELPADSPQKPAGVTGKPSTQRVGKKIVSWAGKLASYQDSKSTVDDGDEQQQQQQRPRVRRVRGLGTVNGTPVKKTSTAAAAAIPPLPSNGTPAPKRRGKGV